MSGVTFEALEPGTQVMIGPSRDVAAEIVQFTFDGNMVSDYLVAWFDGKTRHTAWLAESLFDVVGERKYTQIGFTQEAATR